MNENSSGEKITSNLCPLVIFGSGGHAVSVANIALTIGYKIEGFIDKSKAGFNLLGYKILGNISELQKIEALSFAIAVGDNFARESVYKDLVSEIPNLCFPPLVHPSAIISFFSVIGEGTIVMPKAVIGPNSKVGKFCLINTQASIDHDCSMLDYSSLAPGAITGGMVKIGLRSALSIGAKVKHGLNIGDDCVIGANSYLNEDLPNNQVAYGTPAKQIRMRKIGDEYLS